MYPTLLRILGVSDVMRAIVDTGPLVAALDRAERHHLWTAARVNELEAPLLVCEPVPTEATYLLARSQRARAACSIFSKMARSSWHFASMSTSVRFTG
jgi:predicted nucleic acid-binding protein